MRRRSDSRQPRREKEQPRKRQRGEGSSQQPAELTPIERMLHFTAPAQAHRFERLEDKPFGECRCIDWDVLKQIGLAEEVRQLIGYGSWDRFFAIEEPTFRELTLEFLTAFSLDKSHIGWHLDSTIQFRVNGVRYNMSYTQFSLYMGLYDQEFVESPAYSELIVDFPHGTTAGVYWRRISSNQTYEAKRSKASTLRSPALRYIHALLAHTLSGRGDSFGVVGKLDVYYLYSMRERVPIHLGHALALFLRHQAENARLGAICIGPYVTRLIRGMGLFESLPQMTVCSQMVPISLNTLRSMGMIRRMRGPHGDYYAFPGAPEPEAAAGPQRDRPDSPEPQPEQHEGPAYPPPPAAYQPYYDPSFGQRLERMETRQTWMEDTLASLCQHFSVHITPPPFRDPPAHDPTGDAGPSHPPEE